MKKIIMPNEVLLPEVARLVAEGVSISIRIKGNSMLPLIRGDKDCVVLESPEGFDVMDIVLAEIKEGVFVLHRVIKLDGDKVILMGDGNIKGREVCRRKDVKARAVAIVKEGRKIDCEGWKQVVFARIWRLLLPCRRYLLAIYRRIVKHKMK